MDDLICALCGAPMTTEDAGQHARCPTRYCTFAHGVNSSDALRLAASARLASAIKAERALLASGDERAISQYISRVAKAIDPAIEMRIAIGRGPWDDQILQLMTAPPEVRAAALGETGR